MADTADFTSFAPGFEFLQGLVKNAGAALPGIGQWVAPTLNPEELDKRIQELRTVQFWLEQNARMLGATIQALEVQKMTLTTLQTMNVQMSDLRESLTIRMPGMAAAHSAAGAAMPPEDDDEDEHAPPLADAAAAETARAETAADTETKAAAKPAIDPMQWWGALTQQFSELAAKALKEGAVGLAAVPGAAAAGLDLGSAGASGRSPKAATATSAPARSRPAPAKTASGRRAAAAPARKAAPRAK
jgi:hypothetical protein